MRQTDLRRGDVVAVACDGRIRRARLLRLLVIRRSVWVEFDNREREVVSVRRVLAPWGPIYQTWEGR